MSGCIDLTKEKDDSSHRPWDVFAGTSMRARPCLLPWRIFHFLALIRPPIDSWYSDLYVLCQISPSLSADPISGLESHERGKISRHSFRELSSFEGKISQEKSENKVCEAAIITGKMRLRSRWYQSGRRRIENNFVLECRKDCYCAPSISIWQSCRQDTRAWSLLKSRTITFWCEKLFPGSPVEKWWREEEQWPAAV